MLLCELLWEWGHQVLLSCEPSELQSLKNFSSRYLFIKKVDSTITKWKTLIFGVNNVFVFRHLYWLSLGVLTRYILSCSHSEHLCILTTFLYKRWALPVSCLFLSLLFYFSLSSTTFVPRNWSLPPSLTPSLSLSMPFLSPLLINLLCEPCYMAWFFRSIFNYNTVYYKMDHRSNCLISRRSGLYPRQLYLP